MQESTILLSLPNSNTFFSLHLSFSIYPLSRLSIRSFVSQIVSVCYERRGLLSRHEGLSSPQSRDVPSLRVLRHFWAAPTLTPNDWPNDACLGAWRALSFTSSSLNPQQIFLCLSLHNIFERRTRKKSSQFSRSTKTTHTVQPILSET